MPEFSPNQRSAGIPESSNKTLPEPKKEESAPPSIDKRVNQAELADYIDSEIETALSDRTEWENNLETWLDQYKGILPTKDFPWTDCSNLHIPITATTVDTMLARVINPLYGSKPLVTVKGASEPKKQDPDNPNKGMPDHEKARNIEDMLHFVLDKRINVFPKIYDWVKESLIHGRSTVKIIWKKEKRKVTRNLSREEVETEINTLKEEIDRTGLTDHLELLLAQYITVLEDRDWNKSEYARVQLEEVVYNNPTWINIPVEDVIVSSRARSIEDAKFVAHRFRSTLDELRKKQRSGIYQNVGLIEAGETGEFIDGQRLSDVQTSQEGAGSDTSLSQDDLSGDVECIEWHGKYDIDNDGYLEDVIVTYVRESKTILSAIESPYLHGKKPFASITPFPMPGRLYAPGIPELIHDLQYELNAIHNQRIDNGSITNAPMIRYDPASDIDPDVHKIFPGSMLPAAKDEISILPTPDVKFSQFREEENVRKMIQDRLGITDIQIGSADPSITNDTATGISTIVQEQNQRLELIFKNVRLGLDEAAKQTHQLQQQFGDDQIFYRVVENATETFKTISQREIQGLFDIEIAATSVTTNKSLDLQALQQQLGLAGQFGPAYVSANPLLKEMFEKLGSKRVNEIVQPEEVSFMAKLQEDPQLLLQVKEQIDQLAGPLLQQAGIQDGGGQVSATAQPDPSAVIGQAVQQLISAFTGNQN